MDSLGIVVCQVDAERRAPEKEQGQVLMKLKCQSNNLSVSAYP